MSCVINNLGDLFTGFSCACSHAVSVRTHTYPTKNRELQLGTENWELGPLGKPVFVAAGADATGTEHHGPRAGTHLDFKVLTKDTQAGFFLIEHRNVPQGGPVRHLQYAQEEWFLLIEGKKVVIEVGDERFMLRPGDSILAPRNVPHVWAYVGEKPGRMLMGFTPAGQMEDFFTLSSKQPVDAKIAEAHGMKWIGPPLDVSKL
jgi:mannose-6-phosphate isomerase-like protein (cupin superfamily)